MSPIVRPATSADLAAFSTAPTWGTIRAIVAETDGKVIGIAGLAYQGEHVIAFSEIRDELRRYPVTIMRAARRVLRMLDGTGALAVANPEEQGARRFLTRLGFATVCDRTGTFRWSG